jgi:hypothetical protein
MHNVGGGLPFEVRPAIRLTYPPPVAAEGRRFGALPRGSAAVVVIALFGPSGAHNCEGEHANDDHRDGDNNHHLPKRC